MKTKLSYFIPRPILNNQGVYHFSINAETEYMTILSAIIEFANSELLVGATESNETLPDIQCQQVIKIMDSAGMDVKATVEELKRRWVVTDGAEYMNRAINHQIAAGASNTGRQVTLKYVSTNRQESFIFPDDKLIVSYPEFNITFSQNQGHPHAFAANSRKLERQLLLYKCNYAKNKFSGNTKFDYLFAEIGANPSLLVNTPNIHGCVGMLSIRDCARLTRFNTYLDNGFNINGMTEAEQRRYNDIRSGKDPQICFGKSQDCKKTAMNLFFLHSTYDMEMIDILKIMHQKRAITAHICFIFDDEVLVKDSGDIKGLGIHYEKFWRRNGKFLKVRYIRFSFIGDASLSYVHRWDTYLALLMRTYVSYQNRHYEIHKTDHRVNTIFIELTLCTTMNEKNTIIRNEHIHYRYDCISKEKVVVNWLSLKHDMTKKNGYTLYKKFLPISRHFYNQVFEFLFKTDKSTFVVTNALKAASSFNNRCTFNGTDIIAPEHQLDAEDLFDVVFAIYLIVYKKKNENGLLLQKLVADEKKITDMVDLGFISRFVASFKHSWTVQKSWGDNFTAALGYVKYYDVNQLRAPVGCDDIVGVVEYDQLVQYLLVETENVELGISKTFEILDNKERLTLTTEDLRTIFKTVSTEDATVENCQEEKGKKTKIKSALKPLPLEIDVEEAIKSFTIIQISGAENRCCYRAFFKCINFDLDYTKFLDMLKMYYFENIDTFNFGAYDEIIKKGLIEDFQTEIGSADFLTLLSHMTGINVIIATKNDMQRLPNAKGIDTSLANSIILFFTHGDKIGHYDYVLNIHLDLTLIKSKLYSLFTTLWHGSIKYKTLYKNCMDLVYKNIELSYDMDLETTRIVLAIDEILKKNNIVQLKAYTEVGDRVSHISPYINDKFKISKINAVDGLRKTANLKFKDLNTNFTSNDLIFLNLKKNDDYFYILEDFFITLDEQSVNLETTHIIIKIHNIFELARNLNTYELMYPDIMKYFKFFKSKMDGNFSSECYGYINSRNKSDYYKDLDDISNIVFENILLKGIEPINADCKMLGGGLNNYTLIEETRRSFLLKILIQFYRGSRNLLSTIQILKDNIIEKVSFSKFIYKEVLDDSKKNLLDSIEMELVDDDVDLFKKSSDMDLFKKLSEKKKKKQK